MNFITCRGLQMLRECPIHAHDHWEVILQCSGNAHSRVGDELFEVSPGDLLLIPPHTPHDCRHEALFGDMFISFSSCNFPPTPKLLRDTDGNVERLMHMILKLYTEKEPYHEEIINSLTDAILLHLKKNIQVKIKYPFIRDFRDLLYKNLSNSDFHIGDAITATGYHPDYFRRCFKDELGKSPLQYLTELRLTQAKSQLWQDNFISIEDVAAQCGFADSFYFSTCFKKHEGISPLAYRKTKG